MKKITLSLLAVVLCSAQSMAYAQVTGSEILSNSIIGLNFGYGGQDIKVQQGTTSGDELSVAPYYRYMFMPNIGVEVGWMTSTGGVGSILIDQIATLKEFNYQGPNVKVHLEYPATEYFSIYSNLGVNRYTVDYLFNNSAQSEAKVGFEAALGLETRFDFGLGFNIGYQYLNNQIVSANQVIFGTSFRF